MRRTGVLLWSHATILAVTVLSRPVQHASGQLAPFIVVSTVTLGGSAPPPDSRQTRITSVLRSATRPEHGRLVLELTGLGAVAGGPLENPFRARVEPVEAKPGVYRERLNAPADEGVEIVSAGSRIYSAR
jgi:hypothetical protein